MWPGNPTMKEHCSPTNAKGRYTKSSSITRAKKQRLEKYLILQKPKAHSKLQSQFR